MKSYALPLLGLMLLASCALGEPVPAQTQEEVLQGLGIGDASDFYVLPPCTQVQVYAELGSQFLDLEHSTALVPRWMREALELQPGQVVAGCIVDQGTSELAALTSTGRSANRLGSLRIHALIYLGFDLLLIEDDSVEAFVVQAMCDERVYYHGAIAPIFYASTQPDLRNFPDPNEILDKYCG